MKEEYNQLTGAWLDAFGTIISAYGETRTLVGLNDINNQLLMIGDGLQAFGSGLEGTIAKDSSLDFAGNWIDGAGAATSSFTAYLEDRVETERDELIQLGLLGSSFQSMGASMSALSDYLQEEYKYFVGNALQGLGAGLEAIGSLYVLNEKEMQGQYLKVLGATFQAIGSNLVVIYLTKDLLKSSERL
ncbi:DUF6944 family repetitive protein [Salipaludibacillus daqingensis]|uniref:DUF6944 family repetitive protein n=1 Tax=Salipaludibacillus daqingensis TaxID=3041001 RepID=UPI00247553ED|nr:hypothetical protein [Salipaludibacillus daqingensis]